MAEHGVSLSQDEVDKLLGITTSKSDSPEIEKKVYRTKHIYSESQIKQIRSFCKGAYVRFRVALREKFGEPKVRKMPITAIEHMNIDEFFDNANSNEFLYEVDFNGGKSYIKLDSFLFGALSGLTIDTKHKINRFQSEVLKDFVISLFAESFVQHIKADYSPVITPLFEKEKSAYYSGKTGLCVTVKWNENLRSFGIEKVFLSTELLDSLNLKKGE
ncbi:hypothetical protein [Treponema sp.]|uniref:hypothetical protein n=1 Tax=Treponema sp. TaxID=166 RepID=UPI0038902ECC